MADVPSWLGVIPPHRENKKTGKKPSEVGNKLSICLSDSCLAYYFILKMEDKCSSETLSSSNYDASESTPVKRKSNRGQKHSLKTERKARGVFPGTAASGIRRCETVCSSTRPRELLSPSEARQNALTPGQTRSGSLEAPVLTDQLRTLTAAVSVFCICKGPSSKCTSHILQSPTP
jgi:hypothetical protein